MRYRPLRFGIFAQILWPCHLTSIVVPIVLDMMRDMSFLLGFGLGRRQHGFSEFVTTIDYDTPFGLGYVPIEAYYRYMVLLCKERLRAQLLHMPFDYPIRLYRMILAIYFMRALEGAAWLIDLNGNRFSEPTNVDQLKKYYV